VSVLGVALAAAFVVAAAENVPVTAEVTVAATTPGAAISPNAVGLSFETSILAPKADGTRYFRPDNKALLNLFATLGIKSLRIGGNSVDDPKVPLPREEDVRAFFEFARAAGVKVIYSVRLQDGDPQSAARYAKLIHDDFADVLDLFAIGNEPSYYKDYAVYLPKWKAIRDAILAVYPDAKFCGPDQNPDPKLITKLVHDVGGASGRLYQITQHSYPFGCAYQNPSAGMKDVNALIPFDGAESRAKMLSPDAYQTYEKIQQGMSEAVAGTNLTFRLSETNSYWFSGLKGASDSYASALWAVDYLHWWVAHGAAGLNFHTGDRTGGSVNLPCRYAAFVTSDHGYEVRPLSYGLKLFSLGGSGRSLPVSVSDAGTRNLVAYATIGEGDVSAVTVINKTADTGARPLHVRVSFDRAVAAQHGEVIFMTAKNNDLAGSSGDVFVGGAGIGEDGRWQGKWSKLPESAFREKSLELTLPPASAAVVKVSLR
jgi:hypothetical protein